MESSDSEEDYGLIRPSLIRQLRSILDQYPDDGQILKELIQNAEDAGATEVKFLYDENAYPAEKLHHPDMAQFQGPAFYAYNNAKFGKKDWTGIRMLQDSVKKDDPMKVGRFGLGFKSVLHMTDLPSVASEGRLYMIDPHEKYFQYHGLQTSGYTWHFSKKERCEQAEDHFKPYHGIFGFDRQTINNGYYDGTLFRFPLRQKPSELSDTIYDSARMMDLLTSFEYDAHIILLFLKNLERIQVYRRQKGCQEPDLMFEIKLAAESAGKAKEARNYFKINSTTSNVSPDGIRSSYLIDFEAVKYGGVRKHRQVYNWLVSEYYAGANVSPEMKQLCDNKELSLVPMVGAAIEIKQQTMKDEALIPDPQGQIFCFLPLPFEQKTATGLPVHINGYFAVSQNRRHLKWPTAGQITQSDKSVLWNQCLLNELIPEVYCKLLVYASKLSNSNPALLSPQDVYFAMPDLDLVDDRWKAAACTVFQKLENYAIICSASENRKWGMIGETTFDRLDDLDLETRDIVITILSGANCAIAKVPDHVFSAIERFKPAVITPEYVRATLRSNPEAYSDYSWEDKLSLLSFLISDEKFQDLAGKNV